jgi:hypothetical protein
MTIDVFQIPGYFPSNDDIGCRYTYLTTINFFPVLDSFFCDLTNDKAYKVLQIVYSKGDDRAIVVTVPQGISVKKIFDIPGESTESTIDIFVNVNGKIPANDPNIGCGYGLITSVVGYVPAIRSFFCAVNNAANKEEAYEVTDVLYAIGQERTIVLTVQTEQTVQNIFKLPVGAGS